MLQIQAESIHKIRGGIVAKMVNKHLLRIMDDIKNAPEIKEARSVNLKIKATPVITDGQLDYVDFQFEVGDKCPTRAAVLRAGVTYKNGRQLVMFQEDDPDNPDQTSLLDNQAE